METKIWNAAKNDTLGIESYYNNNKEKYKWETRVEAIVATASKEKDIKKVLSLFKKSETIEKIKETINTNDEQKVIFTSGTMTADHQALPEKFEFKEGVSKIYSQNNAYYVVKVTKLIPQSFRSLDEAKGMVINDYQQELEKKWIKDLKNKYKVTINQDVLNKVKAQIQN